MPRTPVRIATRQALGHWGSVKFVKVMNPTDKHVGGRVRLRHLMLGMSQGTLADNSGLTFQQVQKYKKGVNRISAKKAAR
jgi:hypothetical protein